MKKFFFLFFVLPVSFCFADTIEIDGIQWSYLITNENNRTYAFLTTGIPESEHWVSSGYTTDSNMRVINPKDVSGEVIIPSTILGYPVEKIDANAFYGCSEITSVKMPDCVIDVGKYAFYGCVQLSNIHLSSELTVLRDGIFRNTGLKYLRIPDSVTTLGEYVLSDTAVTEVIVGRGVKSMNSATFSCSPDSKWNVEDHYSTISRIIFLGDEPEWSISQVAMLGTAYTWYTSMPIGFNREVTTCLRCQDASGWGDTELWHGAKLDQYAFPVSITPDSCAFETISQCVELCCEDVAATIYYTIDGSEPSATNGRVYKGPFDIYQTTTVKAIAVKDDWKDSAVVSATFTKANEIGPAINLLEMLPDNDKTHPWTVVTDVTHDGVSAVKSSEISDDEATTMKVVVYGAGELSFWWRTSCEPTIGGEWYDFATFYDGTTAVTNLAGVTDWQRVVRTVEGTGKHMFKWTYQKDGSGSTVPDGVWVDQVQWLPKTDDWYSDHTLTTEAPVKYDWLRKYGLAIEDDFETAAKAATGKSDGTGRELTVEDDFVAGTDPTNELSHLEATIEMTNGVPLVRWTPDLNEDGSKELRTYKIWGKETLDDTSDWEYPTNSLHQFFKVTVEMP